MQLTETEQKLVKTMLTSTGQDWSVENVQAAAEKLFAQEMSYESTYFGEKEQETYFHKGNGSWAPGVKGEGKGAGKGKGGKSGKDVVCFKCQKKGHRSFECPEANCFKCGKNGHLARSCGEAVYSKEEEGFSLWIGEESVMLAEGKEEEEVLAVLDSGATEQFVGRNVLEKIKKKVKVKMEKCRKVFNTANGQVVSEEAAVFPIRLGSRAGTLKAYVLQTDVPLLFGKGAMKKAGAVMRVEENAIELFGQEVSMYEMASGHLGIKVFH